MGSGQGLQSLGFCFISIRLEPSFRSFLVAERRLTIRSFFLVHATQVIRRAHFLLRRRLVPKDVKESREYTEIMLGGSRKNVGLRQHLDNDRLSPQAPSEEGYVPTTLAQTWCKTVL